jgi:hypothetical protein
MIDSTHLARWGRALRTTGAVIEGAAFASALPSSVRAYREQGLAAALPRRPRSDELARITTGLVGAALFFAGNQMVKRARGADSSFEAAPAQPAP